MIVTSEGDSAPKRVTAKKHTAIRVYLGDVYEGADVDIDIYDRPANPGNGQDEDQIVIRVLRRMKSRGRNVIVEST